VLSFFHGSLLVGRRTPRLLLLFRPLVHPSCFCCALFPRPLYSFYEHARRTWGPVPLGDQQSQRDDRRSSMRRLLRDLHRLYLFPLPGRLEGRDPAYSAWNCAARRCGAASTTSEQELAYVVEGSVDPDQHVSVTVVVAAFSKTRRMRVEDSGFSSKSHLPDESHPVSVRSDAKNLPPHLQCRTAGMNV